MAHRRLYDVRVGATRFGGTAVGEPLGRIYGYKTSHIIESEAQADAALYDSNSHGYRRSDGLSIAGRKDVGDYEWKNRRGGRRLRPTAASRSTARTCSCWAMSCPIRRAV